MNKIIYIIYSKKEKNTKFEEMNISFFSGYDADGHAIFDTQLNWPVDFAGAAHKNELSDEFREQLGNDLREQNLDSIIRIIEISFIHADTSRPEEQFYLKKTEDGITTYLAINSAGANNWVSERNDTTISFLGGVLDKKYQIAYGYTPEALPQLEVHNIYE